MFEPLRFDCMWQGKPLNPYPTVHDLLCSKFFQHQKGFSVLESKQGVTKVVSLVRNFIIEKVPNVSNTLNEMFQETDKAWRCWWSSVFHCSQRSVEQWEHSSKEFHWPVSRPSCHRHTTGIICRNYILYHMFCHHIELLQCFCALSTVKHVCLFVLNVCCICSCVIFSIKLFMHFFYARESLTGE